MTREHRATGLFREGGYLQLPIAIYLVAPSGRFLAANEAARTLLQLPDGETLTEISIAGYYDNPMERDHLLRQVASLEQQGRYLDGELIRFRVGEKTLDVRLNCRPFRDSETNELLGYLGCLTDVTEEQADRQLLELMSEGIYAADGSGVVLRANQALVQMFGLQTQDQLRGRTLSEFFSDREEYEAFEALVRSDSFRPEQVVELVRNNQERFHASFRTVLVTATSGRIEGHQGTVVDVTARVQLQRFINDLPMGIYRVERRQHADYVTHCNDQFAKLFDHDTAADVVGRRILDLHKATGRFQEFLESLGKASEKGSSLQGYMTEIVTHAGRRFTADLSCKEITNRRGDKVGRVGVIRDITHGDLLRKVSELTVDIGQVLHTYSQTLSMVQSVFEPTLDALRPIPFEVHHAHVPEEYEVVTQPLVDALSTSLSRLFGVMRERAMQPGPTLESASEALRSYKVRIDHVEFYFPTLRDLAYSIGLECDRIDSPPVSRETIKAVKADASALERVCVSISVHGAQTELLAMDYQLRSLREYVTHDVRHGSPHALKTLEEILSLSIQNLALFAKRYNVRFVRRSERLQVQFRVVEREMVRAFSNIFQNAIKYTRHRDEGGRWVGISWDVLTYKGRKAVKVEIENYGVPIPKDELEDGLIFEFGYRGRLASERGRTGTGIGLSDARRVVRAHGGDIEVESRCASGRAEIEDLLKPYLTTVRIILPCAETKEDRD